MYRKRKNMVFHVLSRKFFCLFSKLVAVPQMPELTIWGLNVGIVYSYAIIFLCPSSCAQAEFVWSKDVIWNLEDNMLPQEI